MTNIVVLIKQVPDTWSERKLSDGDYTLDRDAAEAVIRRTRAVAAIEAAKRPGPQAPAESSPSTQVDVPLPDLSRFNQLLGSGEDSPISVFRA
jgi:hypothetical protein